MCFIINNDSHPLKLSISQYEYFLLFRIFTFWIIFHLYE